MKLITRSDFDGLVCATLLKEVGLINSWEFAHPKDLQDGKVEVTKDVVLANVPFVEGCGYWFDHHSSEIERAAHEGKYEGVSTEAPSAARVIWDYFGEGKFPPSFASMMQAVDKVDSADLTIDEIMNPTGWILLGFIMDPRTGLGRFREFRISNYQLMENLIEACRTMHIDEIMAMEDVKERVEMYYDQQKKFIDMVKKNSKVEEQVVITDLRGFSEIFTGNRFLIYSIFPLQNLSVWIVSGRGGQGCSCAVGHSTTNRTSPLDVGSLMLKYGGGGHRKVGTCQFSNEVMDEKLPQILAEIKELNRRER